MLKSRIGSVLAALAVGLTGCGVTDEQAVTRNEASAKTPSWEEFLAGAIPLGSAGAYIANGDEVFESEVELRAFYDRHVQARQLGTGRSDLLVELHGGQRSVWSATQKRQLTYCVSQVNFGTRYTQVVNDVNTAAQKWEAATGVNFIHLSQFDTDCTEDRVTSGDVLFMVRKFYVNECEAPLGLCEIIEDPEHKPPYGANPPSILAYAFFPHEAANQRVLGLNSENIAAGRYADIKESLIHELGHILGFRHEHIRISQTADLCEESDTSWEALTTYDPDSIMNYGGSCGGNRNRTNLSAKDQQGAQALYGHGTRSAGYLKGIDGKCMDAAWTTGWPSGTNVQLWQCTNGVNQLWSLQADGTVRGAGGLCLDIDWVDGFPNGTKVHLWECTGGYNQQWTLRPDGALQNALGKCLDVDWVDGFPDGTGLQLWECTGGVNQQWQHVAP
ncbi:ricin-type beta-trefoil lectin domain protein [Myxococcus qinghaiensis]|uniref:ricin-type beta-trefoil lectin domain protein n=1 Tax=Myxococcus qinghaiensis TaxID=2906758 RepID=UPI0020A7FDE2|nr:ricin-type beta-trefoil lectin domain protein [Myxococcus qinghaiensis]MCP3163212.1 ricin-type beta-trefoil lectin domain protein [Myxococcus qinghaiensis]